MDYRGNLTGFSFLAIREHTENLNSFFIIKKLFPWTLDEAYVYIDKSDFLRKTLYESGAIQKNDHTAIGSD